MEQFEGLAFKELQALSNGKVQFCVSSLVQTMLAVDPLQDFARWHKK